MAIAEMDRTDTSDVPRENVLDSDPAAAWEAARDRVVANARAEVVRLRDLEAERSRLRIDAAGKLAKLEARSGDEELEQLLAGGKTRIRELAHEVAIVKAELEVSDRVIASARVKREQAIAGVHAAEAGALLARAAQLRAEADDREVRTAQLLAALQDHEGVVYVPDPGPPAPSIHAGDGSLLRGGAPIVVTRAISRTAYLRVEAAALEQQALAIQARRVVRQGNLTAGSVEDLVEACLADEMRIGPAVPELVAWATQAEADLRARAQVMLERHGEHEAREYGYGRPAAWVVTWREGSIDAGQSRAEPAAAAAVQS